LTVLTNARLVQGDQVVDGGWIRCAGERFAEVGRGDPPFGQHRAVWFQGLPVVAAARAAATTPATVLGLDDVGLIAPGRLANLVVLEEDLTVQAIMYRGSWVDGRAP
jgi:hypothetical protein